MKRYLFERYICAAILPYIALSMLLLTAMLLVQQGNRFAEILGSASAPFSVFLEIMAALVPNVLVFTVPMAVLAGTIIGLSRMAADSELIALNAAGVSRLSIIVPVLLLGAAFTVFTVWLGLEAAPRATQSLRGVAYRAALAKLESPIEQQVFNTEIPNKVVYVRGGDKDSGQWENVFIYSNEAGEQAARVITARIGRLDASGETTELVLQDAVSTTLPKDFAGARELVAEHLESLRVRLDTGRAALERQIAKREPAAEELTWNELSTRIDKTLPASDKKQLQFIQQKRLSLCMLPFVFSLLGAGTGMSLRRGGRSTGIFIALGTMISFYLLLLAGESLARSGTVPTYIGAWTPLLISLVAGIFLASQKRIKFWRRWNSPRAGNALAIEANSTEANSVFALHVAQEAKIKVSSPERRRTVTLLGLQDVTILRTLLRNFVCVLLFLLLIFHIFTLLEVWRFVAGRGMSLLTVATYLLYLTPLLAVTLAPPSMLLTALITYALMARRSEAVAWWASGQSIYRLALPCVLFAVLIGIGVWYVQDRVMPQSNRRQDVLRAQIRGSGGGSAAATTSGNGRHWLASGEGTRIYNYSYSAPTEEIKDTIIFEFDDSGVHLSQLRVAAKATWLKTDFKSTADPQEDYQVELGKGYKLLIMPATTAVAAGKQAGSKEVRSKEARSLIVQQFNSDRLSISERQEVFKPTLNKPMHLSRRDLRAYIRQLQARGDAATSSAHIGELLVALERRHADMTAPLVLTLVGVPLAFAFGRKSQITALVAAVIAGLSFWALNGAGNLLGGYGLLPPTLAAWLAPSIYLAAGIYLFSKTKT